MPHCKNTKTIREISRSFEKNNENAMNDIVCTVEALKVDDKSMGTTSKANSRVKLSDKLLILLLFPFFRVANISHYVGSKLSALCQPGCKDMFYELLNSQHVDWRSLLYILTRRMIRRAESASSTEEGAVRCLIADDTDLPKRGMAIELVSRIFSHVTHTYNYGYKALMLGYHDGKSFSALDFSLHGEAGKDGKYGLSDKQRKAQSKKKRSAENPDKVRHDEYFKKKTDNLIAMIRRAIQKGIRFDYLLVDSWFTCKELVRFIKTRRIGCHFLGMVKLGKTNYELDGKKVSINSIIASISGAKYSRTFKCWYTERAVKFDGMDVKLIFCRSNKKAAWKALLTTDLDIKFDKAYRTYATRWTIEVFHKEAKQYLGLGKCQSRDFDAQIAATTISLIQYNILSLVRRVNDYETIGGLLAEAMDEALEQTVLMQILEVIISLIKEIADFFESDMETILEKCIYDNEKFNKLINHAFWEAA